MVSGPLALCVVQMRLMPRPEGWGLHCSDLVYELCNVVGIRNLSVKMRGGRRNKLFVAQVGGVWRQSGAAVYRDRDRWSCAAWCWWVALSHVSAH